MLDIQKSTFGVTLFDDEMQMKWGQLSIDDAYRGVPIQQPLEIRLWAFVGNMM